jgi:negative regulator of replication initiation
MYIFIHQSKQTMHRTQIYLQDSLHAGLKARARSVGVSISELIRRTLERDIQSDPAADARAYFERLKPLQSFAGTDAAGYVRSLRGKSRLLRSVPGAGVTVDGTE